MKSLNEEVFSTTELEEKTRREREVRTDPESRKESGSRKKSTRELHPGKKKKEMGNPVASETGACLGINPSLSQTTANQMD